MKSLNIKIVARLFCAVALLYSGHALGQTYNSNASGPWDNNATWTCGCIPATGTVNIRNNHVVTIPSGYTATATTLNVQSGGTLQNSSALTPAITNKIFQSGSTYDHAQNGGTIITATWQAGSTVVVTGTTTALPSGLNQSFHHFTYNSTVQSTANLFFLGSLTTVNGNLTIENTGSNRQVTLGSNTALFNGALHIFGNFNVNNFSRVQLGSSGTFAVTVDGNLNLSASSQFPDGLNPPITINNVIVNSSGASTTLNILGDLVINGGGRFNMLTATGALTNLNVGGNFNLTNGTFLRDAASSVGSVVNFTFNGTTPQTYTGGGSYTGTSVNYRIASTADVNLQTFALGQPTSTFTNDGIVRLASVDPTSAIVGNIRPNTRTFNAGSTIIYQGAAEQFMGTTHPSGTSVTTTIANSNNVTLSADATIGGTLNLTTGDINLSSRKLTLNGTINPGTHNLNITSSSSLEIGGTGAYGVVPIAGGPDINSLTIARTSGSVIINDDLTIQGTLTQTAGDIHLDGVDLILNGPFVRTTGTIISDDPATTFVLQSAGALPATADFSGTFTTFDFNRDQTMATTSAFNVTNLFLRRGALNNTSSLSVTSGGSIERMVGSLASGVGGTGPLFITYSNQEDIISGGEIIPVNDRVEDVLINGSANVFLANDISINGDFTITSGGFYAQNRTLTLDGNLVVDGFAELSQSTLVFEGNTTISGSSFPTFGTLDARAGSSLTLPASQNIFIAGDVLLAATATVTATNLSMTLNGSVLQTLSPNGLNVNNLTVNKTDDSGVALTTALGVRGALLIQSTNTNFATNDVLTLISTNDEGDDGDAWIGPLIDGASVTGAVHVPRFMTNEGNIYRYLSSPVQDMSVDDLNNFIYVSGSFAGANNNCLTCTSLPSMHLYNNATASYVQFPSASISEEMEIGRGYATFIHQEGLSLEPITIDFFGNINQGNIALPVGFDSNNALFSWNLVGNPYPSSIDWDEPTGWLKGTSIMPGIAVRDNGAGGMFRVWDGEDGDLVEGLIAKHQAFWVQTDDGDDLALEVNENAKSSPVPAPFLRNANTPMDGFVLTLTNSAGLADKAYVKERANAKYSFDRLDVGKLNNQFFDLATYPGEGTRAALAINAINHADCIESLPIVLKDMTAGNYTLSINVTGSFTTRTFKLRDKFTNTIQSFNEGTYPFTVNSNPASFAIDRFEIFQEGIERPKLDLDVVATTPKVCTDAAVITLPNTQANFSYEMVVNGVPTGEKYAGGTSLDIKINNDLLQQGVNNVEVAVTGGCPLNLAKTVAVNKQVLITPVVESRTECVSGSYTIEAVGGGNIKWYASAEDGTAFHTGSSFTTPALASAVNTYYVSSVNANGCEGPRVAASISLVLPIPVVIEVINESEDAADLKSNYTEGNQWSFNGTAIEGATGQTLKADKPGRYTLSVTADGCTATSTVGYSITGLEAEAGPAVAWPNPVQSKLTIDIPSDINVKALWLQTSTGVVFERRDNPSRSVTIDMGQYAPGLYLLVMDTDRGRKVQKIVRN